MDSFFPRCSDESFWADRERVNALIELYESYQCLWKVKSCDYKNQNRKRAAKVEIGNHFGLSGTCNLNFYLLHYAAPV